MLDPFFPQTINTEDTYDDFAVTVVKQFDLSHCIERNVKVTMHGSDIILDVTILQNKAWSKKCVNVPSGTEFKIFPFFSSFN